MSRTFAQAEHDQVAVSAMQLATKGRLKEPGNRYEVEAERIAQQMTASPTNEPIDPLPAAPQIQRAAVGSASIPALDRSLHLGGGEPLPEPIQARMADSFGHSFAQVRIHRGDYAQRISRDLNAEAFAYDQHIFFRRGAYDPHSAFGQRLIAHELAHTIQQRQANSSYRYFSPLQATIQRKEARRGKKTKPESEIARGFATIETEVLGEIYPSIPANLKPLLLGTNLNVGFISGLIESLKKSLPQDDFENFLSGFYEIENLVLFESGGSVGLIIGAGEDLYHNFKGLFYDLPKFAFETYSKLPTEYKVALFLGPFGLSVISGTELYKFSKEPEKRIELYKGFYLTSQDVVNGLLEFVDYLDSNPDALVAEGESLGRIVGELSVKWFEHYIALEPDYYYKGIAVGEVLGYIAMEMALLLVAPEALLVRAGASAGKGIAAATKISAKALKGSRFWSKIRELIEDIPGLKRIANALEQKKSKNLGGNSSSAVEKRVIENPMNLSKSDISFFSKLSDHDDVRFLDQGSEFHQRGYRIEIPLEDGSILRRRQDGIWCRFASPPVCNVDPDALFSQLGKELRTRKRGQGNVHPSPTSNFPEEIPVSGQQYLSILKHPFIFHHFNEISRGVGMVGDEAAKLIMDPAFTWHDEFIRAIHDKRWNDAGNYFHIAAKEAGESLKNAGTIQPYFVFETTIKPGKGGSRADILIETPSGNWFEIDWKTTGKSGIRSKRQMKRHAEQIEELKTIPLSGQASRSWVDYVRGHPFFGNFGIVWP